MRIQVDGNRITGHVDYDRTGHETDVISIDVGTNGFKVASSMCLPVRHTAARLVLACFLEAFVKAESMLTERTYIARSDFSA